MEQRDTRITIFTTFVIIATAIVLVFACSIMMSLRAEVKALKDQLATKEDLVAVKTAGMNLSFTQEKCTRCHTERRFAGDHANGTKKGIAQMIHNMEAQPDVKLSHADVRKIHASLNLMKCASCHSAEEVKKLALMTDAEQTAVIRTMQRTPGSKISPDEIDDIKASFQVLMGF